VPLALTGRPWRTVAAQLLVSVAVIGLLVWDAEPARVAAVLAEVDLRWLGLASGVQLLSLILHELRVWLALDRAVPARAVIRAGLAANLVNLVLPARVADLAAGAWIAHDTGLPKLKGVGGYGIVTAMEMAAFGLTCILLFLGAAPELEPILTGATRREATGWATLLTLGSLGVLVLMARFARRAGGEGAMRQTLRHVADGLGGRGQLAVHLALALVQVASILLIFRLNLEAVGADIATPWFGMAAVLALGALGGLVLPAGMGAGPAAAAVVVVPALGGTAADAVALGVLAWFTGAVPDVLLGLPFVLARVGRG
jgi:uncharacterized membrane protein YbhN (UPF0104 family)